MARGKKTGGRNYTNGRGGGRPLGAKDKVPRGSLRWAIAEIQAKSPELIRDAMEKGLKGKGAHHFLGIMQKVEGDKLTVVYPEPPVIEQHFHKVKAEDSD